MKLLTISADDPCYENENILENMADRREGDRVFNFYLSYRLFFSPDTKGELYGRTDFR